MVGTDAEPTGNLARAREKRAKDGTTIFREKTAEKGAPMSDLAAIKQRQQQTWAAGDFSRIATISVIVGELLCEAVDVHAGQKVGSG